MCEIFERVKSSVLGDAKFVRHVYKICRSWKICRAVSANLEFKLKSRNYLLKCEARNHNFCNTPSKMYHCLVIYNKRTLYPLTVVYNLWNHLATSIMVGILSDTFNRTRLNFQETFENSRGNRVAFFCLVHGNTAKDVRIDVGSGENFN